MREILVLDAVLRAIGALILLLFPLAYIIRGLGRWFDRMLQRKGNAKLERDIRLEMGFLFSEYRGEIAPYRQLPVAFDFATVTIGFKGFYLRMIRGRGDLRVQLSSADRREEWQELAEFLAVHLSETKDPSHFSTVTLRLTGETLRKHMVEISKIMSGGNR